jgi:hypothetical protein
MAHYKTIFTHYFTPASLVLGLAFAFMMATTALAQTEVRPLIHNARTAVHKDIPVMMLALPGRGVLLSAPGEIATITIESNMGTDCGSYLARTDGAGLLEVPVARTPNCPSPRIVVHR